jgi:hypothetical protein
MRRLPLLFALLVSACAGPVRPVATSTLSAVPDAPEERGEHLETRAMRPSAESRQSLSPTERKVETAAATAAAIIGVFFSGSPNAVVGVEAPFEENKILPGQTAPPPPPDNELEEGQVFGPTHEGPSDD